MKKSFFSTNFIRGLRINCGFFTKKTGHHNNNYNSLNYNESFSENRSDLKLSIEIAKKRLGLENHYLKLINQIHSKKVAIINRDNLQNNLEADGSITQDRNIALAVLTADCAPIFIFDTDVSFVCCLHAGWKGCLANIIESSLDHIIKIQPNRNKICAVIGPCLDKNNFEVNIEFKNQFISVNKNYKNFFIIHSKKNKNLFDMRSLINFQFQENHIKNVENIDLDTYDNEDLFFSHRRSTHYNSLPAGRMVNIIGFR